MSDAKISSKAAPVRFESVSKVFGKDGVAVDAGECIVHDGAWTALTLRYAAHGAEFQVGEVFDGREG